MELSEIVERTLGVKTIPQTPKKHPPLTSGAIPRPEALAYLYPLATQSVARCLDTRGLDGKIRRYLTKSSLEAIHNYRVVLQSERDQWEKYLEEYPAYREQIAEEFRAIDEENSRLPTRIFYGVCGVVVSTVGASVTVAAESMYAPYFALPFALSSTSLFNGILSHGQNKRRREELKWEESHSEKQHRYYERELLQYIAKITEVQAVEERLKMWLESPRGTSKPPHSKPNYISVVSELREPTQ
jgi:hypothetical protein